MSSKFFLHLLWGRGFKFCSLFRWKDFCKSLRVRHAPDWLNSKRRTDQRLDQHCARDSVANQLCMNLYNSLYRWYSLTLPRFQQKTWSGEIMFSIITLKRVIWAPREKKIALPSQKKWHFFEKALPVYQHFLKRVSWGPLWDTKNQHPRGFIGTSLHFKIYLLQLYPGPMISPIRLWPSSFWNFDYFWKFQHMISKEKAK